MVALAEPLYQSKMQTFVCVSEGCRNATRAIKRLDNSTRLFTSVQAHAATENQELRDGQVFEAGLGQKKRLQCKGCLADLVRIPALNSTIRIQYARILTAPKAELLNVLLYTATSAELRIGWDWVFAGFAKRGFEVPECLLGPNSLFLQVFGAWPCNQPREAQTKSSPFKYAPLLQICPEPLLLNATLVTMCGGNLRVLFGCPSKDDLYSYSVLMEKLLRLLGGSHPHQRHRGSFTWAWSGASNAAGKQPASIAFWNNGKRAGIRVPIRYASEADSVELLLVKFPFKTVVPDFSVDSRVIAFCWAGDASKVGTMFDRVIALPVLPLDHFAQAGPLAEDYPRMNLHLKKHTVPRKRLEAATERTHLHLLSLDPDLPTQEVAISEQGVQTGNKVSALACDG